MMTMIIPDEILEPGPGRLRALVCLGGNPAVAIPDEVKTRTALGQLDLLVTIDPRLSETAKLADYVIAPRLYYERPDHTGSLEVFFSVPYANYTPAIVEPGPDFDVVHDWYVFWRIAQHLGLDLPTISGAAPEGRAPTPDELLAHFSKGSRVPLDEVKAQGHGHIYPVEPQIVEAARPEAGKLDLLADDVADELAVLARELSDPPTDEDFPLRLVVRRRREAMNSAGADFEAFKARLPYNAAFLHPDDVSRLGLAKGDSIAVESRRGRIAAIVEADDTLRPGLVSMTHCWSNPERDGAPSGTTSALIDADAGAQTINGMPVLTGVPVRVARTN